MIKPSKELKTTNESFSKLLPSKRAYLLNNLEIQAFPILIKDANAQIIYNLSTFKYIVHIDSIKKTIENILCSTNNNTNTRAKSIDIGFLKQLFDGFFAELDFNLNRCKINKVNSNIYNIDNQKIDIDVFPVIELILGSMMIFPIYINNILDYPDIYYNICNFIDVGSLSIIAKYCDHFNINFGLRDNHSLTYIMINHHAVQTLCYCLKNLRVDVNKKIIETLSAKINALKKYAEDKHYLSKQFEELYIMYNDSFASNKIYEKYIRNNDLQAKVETLKKENKDLETEMETLRKQYKDLQTELNTIRTQLENATTEIGDIEIIDEKL
uniref:Uncharacterized protein n=1 Tax=viral metagenome TaxID=1070528 RepID=A0A6C0E7P4_9ZZZZ